jgi:hypothetical protein
LVAAALATTARFMGASWQQIVWGALGLIFCAGLSEFFAWLTTGGPLRLEKRPAQQDVARRTDGPE